MANVKVLLCMIVKNEEKIIQRCLDSMVHFIDAMVITDTGSTDGTKKIIEEYARAHGIDFSIPEHAFINFQHNRTLSIEETKKYVLQRPVRLTEEITTHLSVFYNFLSPVSFCSWISLVVEYANDWSLSTSYAILIDADMIYKDHQKEAKEIPAWKHQLNHHMYLVKQSDSILDYDNVRLLSLAENWVCKGVTHEAWYCITNGGPAKKLTDFWFYDFTDGGSKADKFERDIRLLSQGVQDEPDNDRYWYYLAESYKNSGQKEKSIEWYLKRAACPNFPEEKWHARYSLGKVLWELDRKGDALRELWKPTTNVLIALNLCFFLSINIVYKGKMPSDFFWPNEPNI